MSLSKSPRLRSVTARGIATRGRVVRAAADLMHARGVERTSLDDVMAKSGVSKSQLYHYFTDKDALVLEVIALQTDRVLAAQQPQLDALDSLAALRRWADAVTKLNKVMHSTGCPLGSLSSDLANEFEDARELLLVGFETWTRYIERGLVKMRERGELAQSANPHDLAVAVLCAVQGGLLLSKTQRKSRPLEIAIDMAYAYIARQVPEER